MAEKLSKQILTMERKTPCNNTSCCSLVIAFAQEYQSLIYFGNLIKKGDR